MVPDETRSSQDRATLSQSEQQISATGDKKKKKEKKGIKEDQDKPPVRDVNQTVVAAKDQPANSIPVHPTFEALAVKAFKKNLKRAR